MARKWTDCLHYDVDNINTVRSISRIEITDWLLSFGKNTIILLLVRKEFKLYDKESFIFEQVCGKVVIFVLSELQRKYSSLHQIWQEFRSWPLSDAKLKYASYCVFAFLCMSERKANCYAECSVNGCEALWKSTVKIEAFVAQLSWRVSLSWWFKVFLDCWTKEQTGKMLKVTVQRATDLPDVDKFGKSDPYAKVIFHGKFQCLINSFAFVHVQADICTIMACL